MIGGKDMNVSKLFGGTILILVLIVGGLIFILQIPEKFNILRPKPSSTPKVQTNILKADTQKIKEELTKTDKKVGDLDLAENEQYDIDYLISNDQFFVVIKKEPYKDSKVAAEEWFISKGFKKTDLCLFRINFVPSDAIKSDPTPEDNVPTGCDPPQIDTVESTQ